MAALDQLATVDDEGAVRIVIEASAGTRTKFKYDEASGVFELHHVIPPGTSFPLDFGFVPRTLGEDGDPLDALVFADEPTPVGIVVPARIIGVIEAKQARGGKKPQRNDRFIAVAKASHSYDAWQGMDDVPPKLLEAVEAFFVTYNEQRGTKFTPVGRRGSKQAQRLLRQGESRFERK